MTSQAQRYLEKLDIGYSYRLAKRMEEHCTNPVLGYRTAGSPAEIATGDMLAAEMKKIGFSKVWKDAITVDAWEFEKAELSFTDAEGRERPAGGVSDEFRHGRPYRLRACLRGQGHGSGL